MLLENKNYTESGYIGEELLGGATYELQQKCMAVQQSIEDNDFPSYSEALKAYGVKDIDYKDFLAKSTNQHIFLSFSGAPQTLMQQMYLQVYEKMLLSVFPHHGRRVKNIVKEIEQMSIEMEHQK
jgi:hypothetical protein